MLKIFLVRSARDFIYIHDVLVEAIVAGETSIKTSYLSRYITSLQSCRYSAQVAGDKYQLERQHDLLSVDFVKKTDSSRAAASSSGELVWLPGYYSLQTLALASYPRQVHI